MRIIQRKYLLGFTLKFSVVHEIGMCILRDVGCRILQHDAHPAEYSWIIELVAIKLRYRSRSGETYLSSTFKQIAWKLNTHGDSHPPSRSPSFSLTLSPDLWLLIYA